MSNNSISHLALIMDGNKRWSIKNSTNASDAYISGLNNLVKIAEHCINLDIKILSVYALSSENIQRPDISTIFNIIKDKSNEVTNNLLLNKNIKINFIGELENIPKQTLVILKRMEKLTKKNYQLDLNIVLNYHPYEELKSIIQNLISKNITKDISNEDIENNMYLSGIPKPDLLIRTGGYKRLSNFLLLYLGYTEFSFTKTLWPDLSIDELDSIISEFSITKRNYGL